MLVHSWFARFSVIIRETAVQIDWLPIILITWKATSFRIGEMFGGKRRVFPKGLAHDFDQKLEISSLLRSEPILTTFTPFALPIPAVRKCNVFENMNNSQKPERFLDFFTAIKLICYPFTAFLRIKMAFSYISTSEIPTFS